jgi:hypothetical protein
VAYSGIESIRAAGRWDGRRRQRATRRAKRLPSYDGPSVVTLDLQARVRIVPANSDIEA